MKLDYLTDDSEKCLAPFFSDVMMSITFYSSFIIAGLLIIFWPQRRFFSYIYTNTIPILFFLIFSATLIINAYVNLRCGRGEMNKRINFHEKVSEKANDFFKYGLVEFLLHTLFLILPFLPLLILSASISVISAANCAKALSIVFTASLFCRLFAFMIYLFIGRSSRLGHLLVRAFIILFLFGTLHFARPINPFQILYEINIGLNTTDAPYHDAYMLYIATVLFASLLLTVLIQITVKRHMNKERLT